MTAVLAAAFFTLAAALVIHAWMVHAADRKTEARHQVVLAAIKDAASGKQAAANIEGYGRLGRSALR